MEYKRSSDEVVDMPWWGWLSIGFLAGGCLGVVIVAILVAGDDDRERLRP